MGSIDTTWLNGWGTWVRVNHSSFQGSSKSRFDKSRSACTGNAQTSGFRRITTPTGSCNNLIRRPSDTSRTQPATMRLGSTRPDIDFLPDTCRRTSAIFVTYAKLVVKSIRQKASVNVWLFGLVFGTPSGNTLQLLPGVTS